MRVDRRETRARPSSAAYTRVKREESRAQRRFLSECVVRRRTREDTLSVADTPLEPSRSSRDGQDHLDHHRFKHQRAGSRRYYRRLWGERSRMHLPPEAPTDGMARHLINDSSSPSTEQRADRGIASARCRTSPLRVNGTISLLSPTTRACPPDGRHRSKQSVSFERYPLHQKTRMENGFETPTRRQKAFNGDNIVHPVNERVDLTTPGSANNGQGEVPSSSSSWGRAKHDENHNASSRVSCPDRQRFGLEVVALVDPALAGRELVYPPDRDRGRRHLFLGANTSGISSDTERNRIAFGKGDPGCTFWSLLYSRLSTTRHLPSKSKTSFKPPS